MLLGLKKSSKALSISQKYFSQTGVSLSTNFQGIHLNKNFRKNSKGNYLVTLFKGDGIGPEIADSVVRVFQAAACPIEWEQYEIHSKAVSKDGDLISDEAIDSVKANKVALKGPFMTPIGTGFKSLNVTLRRKLQLYANVRPCKTLDGLQNIYHGVDVVTIRENTEGEYSGLEHTVAPGIQESLKIISKPACH